jgi:hypothetical protein
MMQATTIAASIAISVVMSGASAVDSVGSVGSGVVGSGVVGVGSAGVGCVGSGVIGSGSSGCAGDGASVTPIAVSANDGP